MKIPANKILPDQEGEIEMSNIQAWDLLRIIADELYKQFTGPTLLDFRRELNNHFIPELLNGVNDMPLGNAVVKLTADLKATRQMTEYARECESLAHMALSEKLRLCLSEGRYGDIKALREYVPLPQSVFPDHDAYQKTSPSNSHKRSDSEQLVSKPRKATQSNEDKQVAKIANLMFKDDIEKAKEWVKNNA